MLYGYKSTNTDVRRAADVVTYTAILDIYAKAAAQGLEGDWVNLSLQILQVNLTTSLVCR